MIAELLALALASGPPTLTTMYRPADRSVSNWRVESLRHLDLALPQAATILTGREPPRLPRCVKLNNYWCIKSARWNGEIATDGEGHVAFASAVEGAAVAVALLRRYYLDFGRKSALSIVSRWAPAQCGFVAARPAGGRTAARASADRLATRGIRNTLRARFLAARGGRVAGGGRRPAVRSVVPDRPIAMMRAPSIAAGMGERPVALASLAPATSSAGALGRLAGGDRGGAAVPRISCSGEAVRIRNYANAVIQGVAGDVNADLRLFETDGAPSPNLARVMANMAAVEIGPYKPGQPLVTRVIDIALEVAGERRQKREAEKTAPAAN